MSIPGGNSPIFVNLFGVSHVYPMYAVAVFAPRRLKSERAMNTSYCRRNLERIADRGFGQTAETPSVYPLRC